ncbi:Calcium/calmodulin-dependent protein kinase [Penicillium chermesinum]|uniref:Calcium/calmodulin-dependent protein kinase n=1 Tax=Penicillium chermesinum TaxID=63820 RepID=A0A9W9TID8_9EURO|nr:Calcium/calmodulin-dependent protein kinase [Penicillium chermesinum]KAJ5223624.1 Calcium/calmodulin-dependent protein kinase [Penicillium chermesinum]
MSTTTQTQPINSVHVTPGNPKVLGRMRGRRKAGESDAGRQLLEDGRQGAKPPTIGFMKQCEVPSNMPSYPGLDRWRLLEKLGDGAFSSVYRASDTKSQHRDVAIKVMRKYEMNDRQKTNLQEEVNISRKLDHDNVVRLIDSFESRQYYYMILELCPGGELYDQIVSLTSLSEQMSRHVITQVAHAVEYLHDTMGVVHRDIKPENILLCPSSATPAVTPMEGRKPQTPGIDKDREEAVSIAKAGADDIGVVKIADFGVDMWGIGCLLFTMLSGFPPFYDEDLKVMTRKVMKGEYSFSSPNWESVSPEAKDLVSKLLTINPEDRLNIKEFLAHPWVWGDEDTTPSNETTAPTLDDPKSELQDSHRLAMKSSAAFRENETNHYHAETPSIKEVLNVSFSVQQQHHERQMQDMASHAGRDSSHHFHRRARVQSGPSQHWK